MKTLAMFLLASVGLSMLLPAGAWARWETDMFGVNVIPPTQSPAVGSAFGNMIGVQTFILDCGFSDLLSPPIAVELRGGTPWVNGRLFKRFTDIRAVIPGEYTLSEAEFSFNEAQGESLYSGLYYLVVTTQAFPNGEIRGQFGYHEDPALRTTWGRVKAIFR